MVAAFLFWIASGSQPWALASDSREPSLRLAAREGRLKEVKRLITDGVDPNASGEFGETALMNAARYNRFQVVEALVERGASVDLRDSNDATALHLAAVNCSHRVSSQLIEADANVNLRNGSGRTALSYAADEGCLPMVRQLLGARGIDVNAADDSGRTPLDYALVEAQLEVGGQYTDIARELRGSGARESRPVGIKPRKSPTVEPVLVP